MWHWILSFSGDDIKSRLHFQLSMIMRAERLSVVFLWYSGTWRAAMFPSPWRESASLRRTPRPLPPMTADRKDPAGRRDQKVHDHHGCSSYLGLGILLKVTGAHRPESPVCVLSGSNCLAKGSVWSLTFGRSRQKAQPSSSSGRGDLTASSCPQQTGERGLYNQPVLLQEHNRARWWQETSARFRYSVVGRGGGRDLASIRFSAKG